MMDAKPRRSEHEPPAGHGADLVRIYRNRFDERKRRDKELVWEVVVRHFLQRWVGSQDTVLDIGCGQGEFLNHVRCARRIGVDLNPDCAGSLSDEIEFHAADVRNLSFLPADSIDVAFTSNLLEHLPSKDDVEMLLSEARRVLRPGGHLIALGPNLRFVPGEYWDFWDHHTPITDRSLVELLVALGFEITDCHPKFLPYTTLSRLPKWRWLVRLYLALPLAWRWFGRQFLIRARRP